jgi:hypothetical protein
MTGKKPESNENWKVLTPDETAQFIALANEEPKPAVVPDMLEDGAEVAPQADPQKEQKKTNWVEDMLDLYSEGMCDAEVRRELKITKAQFDDYCGMPEFHALVQRGREYSEAWWKRKGRVAVRDGNKDFPTTVWQYNMANRFGWASKRESVSLDPDINLDKVREELANKAPDILKMLGIMPGQAIDVIPTRKALEKTRG